MIKMKCRMLFCCLFGLCAAVQAMPTQTEVKKVESLVIDLMKDDQEALRSGRKTRAEVAASAIGLADQADSEAAKLLLLKGAFNLYVRAGDFDKAVETLQLVQRTIPDIPAVNLANIIETALRSVSRKNGGQLYQLLADAKARARYQGELKSLQVAAKKKNAKPETHLALAEHYAFLGGWQKALDEFALADGDVARIAKGEKDGSVALPKVADFWWDYPEGKDDGLEKCFRRHAAELYGMALGTGEISGLAKIQAERRVKDAEAYGEDIFASANGMVSPKGARPVKFNLAKGVDLDLILCPPGTFRMGKPGDNDPHSITYEHEVTLTYPFQMAKYPLTVGQWEAVMGPYPWGDWEEDKMSRALGPDAKVRLNQKRKEIDRYLAALNAKFASRLPKGCKFRLPTEAEWLYAFTSGGQEIGDPFYDHPYISGDKFDRNKVDDYGCSLGEVCVMLEKKGFSHKRIGELILQNYKKHDPWNVNKFQKLLEKPEFVPSEWRDLSHVCFCVPVMKRNFNKWGFCDYYNAGRVELALDRWTFQNADKGVKVAESYSAKETDPWHCSSGLAGSAFCIRNYWTGYGKVLCRNIERESLVHLRLVLGPELKPIK